MEPLPYVGPFSPSFKLQLIIYHYQNIIFTVIFLTHILCRSLLSLLLPETLGSALPARLLAWGWGSWIMDIHYVSKLFIYSNFIFHVHWYPYLFNRIEDVEAMKKNGKPFLKCVNPNQENWEHSTREFCLLCLCFQACPSLINVLYSFSAKNIDSQEHLGAPIYFIFYFQYSGEEWREKVLIKPGFVCHSRVYQMD